jgi:hypothetical protein
MYVIYVKEKYVQKFLHSEYCLQITILTVGNKGLTLHNSQLLNSKSEKKTVKKRKYYYKGDSEKVQFKIWCRKRMLFCVSLSLRET